MTYRVLISDCVLPFHRAHNALVDSLGGSAHIARTTKTVGHWALLEHNWKLKYNALPCKEKGHTEWKYLEFPSEKHYTSFLLQWS